MYGDKDINAEMDAVSKLHRVTAPANFEDSVMRAIRLRSAEAPQRSYAWLKVALPTAALLLLAAFLGMSSLTNSEMPRVEVAGQDRVPDPLATLEKNGSTGKVAGIQNVNTNREKEPLQSNSVNSQPSKIVPGGGTLDQAARPGEEGTLPKGIDPNARSNQTASQAGVRSTVRVSTILQVLGVRSENRGGEVVVASVVAGSTAATAGLQPGDVLLTINDVSITPTATFPGGDIQTVRIRRDGQTMTLKF